MKKYHLIIILTAIFFNFGVAIAENRREVNIANELHSGIKFHLIVRNSPFNRSSNKLKRLWGDFGGNDNEVISKMLFELNGQKVLIPNLAYGDLLNVELNAIQVTEINENISISIKGGDGEVLMKAE